MLALPALIPVTRPVLAPTVATAPSLLLHVPPDVALLNDTAWPTHTTVSPVFAASPAFTVATADTEQLPRAYIIVVVPAAIAVTTPVDVLIVATPPSLLLQAPPVVAELNADVLPEHSAKAPEIAEGAAVTVATSEAKQPADRT
jgi:hypothetical protein